MSNFPLDERVKTALEEASLLDYFESLAPSHQQEYLRWIAEAKKEDTKTRRINKMMTILRKKQG